MTEHDLQATVIAECNLRANQDPLWAMIAAIPNGGHRHKATAGRLKAEGVRAGLPDLVCLVARNGYHALFIELKVGRNKCQLSQLQWHRKLAEQGYAVRTVWDDAAKVIQIIEAYLNGVPT